MNRDTVLTIRINLKTKKELFEISKRKGLSTSEVLNYMIHRFIEENYKLLSEGGKK